MPDSRLLLALALVSAIGGVCAPPDVSAQEAEPFKTRNLSPMISIFGLPTWHVPSGSFELAVTSELANHYRLSGRGTEQLILDGETWRNSLFLSKQFADGWSVSLELPHYRIAGGILDDVVDGWHSIFGLPDGGRNNRPEGDVLFELAQNGQAFYLLDDGASAFGDVQIGIAYALGRNNGFHVKATVKLPTGDEDLLAGSGSTDWSVTLLRSREVSLGKRAAGYFWGIGAIQLGHADRILYAQEDGGLLGLVGGSLQLTQNIGVKLQLDMHTALYNSQLEEIGEDAFQATIGGWWSFTERGRLDFGINEDLEVSTSPDVVLHVNAQWRW